MNLRIILFVLILTIIPISSTFAGMSRMINNVDTITPTSGGFFTIIWGKLS